MSLTIVVGSNRFTACVNLIAYRDQPVLRVLGNPLRVTLRTPPESRSDAAVVVDENRIVSRDEREKQALRVVASEMHVAIFWKELPVVIATGLDPETVHVRLDLRPLGVRVYDDGFSLHIGDNTLSSNLFEQCTTAISLQ